MINEVGYLDNAIDKAIEMAGLSDQDPKVTVVRQPGEGLIALLGADRASPGLADLSPDNVRTWLEDLGEVKLSYRMRFD